MNIKSQEFLDWYSSFLFETDLNNWEYWMSVAKEAVRHCEKNKLPPTRRKARDVMIYWALTHPRRNDARTN